MKYGFKYTMGHNGCELIAIYNALKLTDSYQNLSDIALEFELNGGMAMTTELLSTYPAFSKIGIFWFKSILYQAIFKCT